MFYVWYYNRYRSCTPMGPRLTIHNRNGLAVVHTCYSNARRFIALHTQTICTYWSYWDHKLVTGLVIKWSNLIRIHPGHFSHVNSTSTCTIRWPLIRIRLKGLHFFMIFNYLIFFLFKWIYCLLVLQIRRHQHEIISLYTHMQSSNNIIMRSKTSALNPL